jgi:two-component system, NarL family, captular synthesis response regulator RcsB
VSRTTVLRIFRTGFVMKNMPIQVAIADDHPALLIGISHELAGASGIKLVGCAANSTELISILGAQRCDVIVTDYAMPGGEYGDGIALIEFVKRHFPGVQIVVLTMMENSGIFKALLKQGVRCIISKADPAFHIENAIRVSHLRGEYFSPTVGNFIKKISCASSLGVEHITKREAEVIRLFVSGLGVNEIASRLSRSKQTVSAQKRSAMKKLGIDRESDLFRYAYERGLISCATPFFNDGVIADAPIKNDFVK